MQFERLTCSTHPMYQKALDLYRISFPHHEQRQSLSQEAILQDDAYHFTLLYDEDAFVGLLLCWETPDFIYVEHFCILPELRSKGYGQQALNLLGQQDKTVILEIDPPVDAISLRRKGFYQRCGFVENPYPHIHPPYHKGNHPHDLVIMTLPAGISQAAYDQFNSYLSQHVMKDVY